MVHIARDCASVLGLRLLTVAGCCRCVRLDEHFIAFFPLDELWASHSVGGQSSGHPPLASYSGELRHGKDCCF